MKRKEFLQTACMLTAALLLLAACTQDELSDKQGEPLPEGKYPLTFTASIDGEAVAATPQTRATADGTWEEENVVFIKVNNDSYRYYRSYQVTSVGSDTTTLKISSREKTPYYWQNTDPIPVSAFFLPAGSSDLNDNALLFVQSNQNETDPYDYYQSSDFLYANDNISFPTKTGNKTLHFFHQTAKVVVHIIKGDQTPADITTNKISMTIGTTDSQVYTWGRWKAPTSYWNDNTSKILGTWEGNRKETITPKQFDAQAKDVSLKEGETLLASYKALVIPQTIAAGKKLFVINTTDNEYAPFYYTVPAGNITWQAGTEHTYYITIKGSSLSVTTSESIGWDTDGTASGSGSVTFIGNKMAKDAEIGDFYMSDGTLVDSEADLTAGQKAACRGIVYCVDNSFITSRSTNKSAGDYTHGLAVALKDADSCPWYNQNNAVSSYSVLSTSSLPANSSGWYVPNIDELKYICRGSNYETKSVNGRNMLHTQFGQLGSANANEFVSDFYWSSTEFTDDYVPYVGFGDGDVSNYYTKNFRFIVRCAFAF